MHLTILPGANGEFQKSQENATFLKMRKESTISKISIVWCFCKSDRPVCNRLNVNFIKHTLKTIFFFKKSIFAFKIFEVKENCSKTPLNVCPLKCTYIGKIHFSFSSVWSEIMSFKSDRLEIGLSICYVENL